MDTRKWFLVMALILVAGAVTFLFRSGNIESSEAVAIDQSVFTPTDIDQTENRQASSNPGGEMDVGAAPDKHGAANSEAALRRALREASKAEALASERTYIKQQRVDMSEVAALLDLEQVGFHEVIDRLHSEAFDDPLAQELTELYQDSLSENLASFNEDLSLESLACGLRLCIGAFSGPAGFENWDEFKDSHLDRPGSLPRYVTAIKPLSGAQGSGVRDQYRMFFSTDPDNSAATFPRGP